MNTIVEPKHKERLLFLDIDGVLNAHEWDEEVKSNIIRNDKVLLLNHILRTTQAKIVLSSAWRYLVHRGEMTMQGLEWLFRSHGILANRLHGITRQDTHYTNPWQQQSERGKQITEYVKYCNGYVRAYAVVDDLDLGISEAGHPFVRTDGKVGLTLQLADKLIELFNVD